MSNLAALDDAPATPTLPGIADSAPRSDSVQSAGLAFARLGEQLLNAGVLTASQDRCIWTEKEYENFVIDLEFKTAPGTNSGVFLRTSPKPSDVTSKCYELNIADVNDNPFPTGSFVQRLKAEGDHDSADWQTFEVTADGAHFLVRLDGETVLAPNFGIAQLPSNCGAKALDVALHEVVVRAVLHRGHGGLLADGAGDHDEGKVLSGFLK